MTTSDEKLLIAAQVQESIEVIEQFREYMSGTQEFAHMIASQILKDLPEQVGTYTHSEELPTITATRYEGETWDYIKALEWVSGVFDGDESNSELRNRLF